MIKIITIEREYGCGGGEIAELVAKRLGWKLWDQSLTEEIARLARCPMAVVEGREERTDPLYYRLFKSFLRGSYEGSINAPKLNLVDSETILTITRRVVEHAAKHGNLVIVGRDLIVMFGHPKVAKLNLLAHPSRHGLCTNLHPVAREDTGASRGLAKSRKVEQHTETHRPSCP